MSSGKISFLLSDSALNLNIFIDNVVILFSISEKSAKVFTGSNSNKISFFFTISPIFA